MRNKFQIVGSALEKLGGSEPWLVHESAWPAIGEMISKYSNQPVPEDRAVTLVSGEYTNRFKLIGSTAVIELKDVLTNHPDFWTMIGYGTSLKQVQHDFLLALEDSRVEKIVLACDSPGGSAVGCEEVSDAIYAARGKKEIVSSIDGMCASACYKVASAADQMFAAKSSLIGSIGSMMPRIGLKKFYEKFGLEVDLFHFGENKIDLHPLNELTDQARENIQELVNEFGQAFVKVVARNRNTTEKKVMDDFGQGKVFQAEKAKSLGMIDQIGTYEVKSEKVQSSGITLVQPGSVKVVQDSTSQEPAASSPVPGSNSQGDNTKVTEEKKQMKYSAKLLSLLHAFEYIDKLDCSEEVVTTAIKAAYRGAKENCPDLSGDIDEATNQKLVEFFTNQNIAPASANETPVISDQDFVSSERLQSLQMFAETINNGLKEPLITSQMISDAAQDSEKSINEVMASWNNKLEEENPVPNPRIEFGESSLDKFQDQMTCRLFQLGGDYNNHSFLPESGAGDLSNLNFAQIFAVYMGLTGNPIPISAMSNDAELFELFDAEMAKSGAHRHNIESNAGGAYTRAGDLKTIMNNQVQLVFDESMNEVDVKFEEYSERDADFTDISARQIAALEEPQRLGEVFDDEEAKEINISEELLGHMYIRQFSSAVSMGPNIMLGNNFNMWFKKLSSLGKAARKTVNELVLHVLHLNPTFPDGSNFYRTENTSTSLAAPSPANAKLAKEAFARMKSPSATGDGDYLDLEPRISLVPTALEDDAIKTYALPSQLVESLVKNTDANLNLYRGRVKVVKEPRLEKFANGTSRHFVFANKGAIKHAYMNGYGDRGRRESQYDARKRSTSWFLTLYATAGHANWRNIFLDGAAAP